MLSISNLNRLMSPSDCSHINIQTIHFGVVAIELLPTQNSLGVWCTLLLQRTRFDSGRDVYRLVDQSLMCIWIIINHGRSRVNVER